MTCQNYMQFFAPSADGSRVTPLGELQLGRPVQGTKLNDDKRVPADRYGFITGFSRNSSGELTLDIAWDDGRNYGAHPSNLILL